MLATARAKAILPLFIGATNRGPSIVTEIEIPAWDAPARQAKPLLLSFAATTAG
jgi:hypothetical protein